MSFFSKPLSFRSRQDEFRRKRRLEGARLERRRQPLGKRIRALVFPVLLFCAMVLAIIAICFWGRSAVGIYISPNQVASIRVVAQEDFSYPSEIQRRHHQRQRQLLVPTVITTDPAPLLAFEQKFGTLNQALDAFAQQCASLPNEPERLQAAVLLSDTLRRNDNLEIAPADLLLLAVETPAKDRHRLLSEALAVVAKINRDGIYDPEKFAVGQTQNQNFLFSSPVEGEPSSSTVRSEKNALSVLRREMPETKNGTLNIALYSLFSQGIRPNLKPDAEATRLREDAAMMAVPAIIVSVKKGQTIIEDGELVSPEDIEKLHAYQAFLNEHSDVSGILDGMLMQYALLTVVLLLSGATYLKIALPNTSAPRNKLLLMCTALLLTLSFARAFIELNSISFFIEHPELQGIFSLLVPSVFGALLVSVLIGTRPAVLVGLMSALFCALMTGYSLGTFVGSFLVSLITIYMTRGIHQRARIIRASFFAGLVVAALVLIFGLNENRDWTVLLAAMGASIAMCVLGGLIALALFPIFEYVFKITTDIRLLELTDFNHPLLRRLQIDAPGTYHHSLMVANLAERAAADIGANPIVCRVGALFHDIGKIDRPEYFTENQRNGINPHNGELTPPMSALIIKSHVKEGAQIAREAKMPQVVYDAITQHHGTTLMRYFYDKANRLQQEDGHKMAPLDHIEEATYRYDGPRPQTKESAVIQLADSVEAASRSLKKVNPQSVEELITYIVRDKIIDGQLDECPITLQEISRIKKSFEMTLLTMLHGRVSYTPAAQGKTVAK